MSATLSDAVLVLVCGLPAAGKTTLVKHLVGGCNTRSRLYERISFDDLYEQQMINNGESRPTRFDPETWKACQQGMALRVSTCLRDYMSGTSGGSTHQLVLLIDDNFQYRSLRKRFFHLAIEMSCGFGLLYVNTSVATCRKRNADRGDDTRVPDEVFERMVAVYEAPNGRQISWEVNTREVKEMEDVSNIGDVANALVRQAYYELKERRLAQMDAQREAAQQHCDRLSTQQNVLHLVDLQLRRWISTQLQDEKTLPPGLPKSQFAFHLNQRRKSYLASMKRSYGNVADRARVQGGSIEEVAVWLVHQFQHQESSLQQ